MTTSLSAKLAVFEANISNNNVQVSQDKSFIANSAFSKNKLSARKVSAPKPATKRVAWEEITEAAAKTAVSFVDLTGILLDEDVEKEPKQDCVCEDVSFSSLDEENVTEVTVDFGVNNDDSAVKVEEEEQVPEDEHTEEHAASGGKEERGCMVDWRVQQKAIVRLRANKSLSGLSTLKISDRVKTLQESYNTLETCSVCSESFHGGK